METDVLRENRDLANKNLSMLRKRGIRSIDVMGSIGSGKTSLIIELARQLMSDGLTVAAIAGDVAGEDDYQRFISAGIRTSNVNTGKECHLDAHLIQHALEAMDLDGVDVLFIENVGNLVCPADFPLGTDIRMVVISVTEGDDMIRKHPVIFGTSDIAVLNKMDLIPVLDVDSGRLRSDYGRLRGKDILHLTSARSGEGIDDLIKALGLR